MRGTLTTDNDIIALTETWLNDSFTDSEIFCDRYQVFRRDRLYDVLGCVRGGGVLCAVLNSFSSTVLTTNKFPSYDDIWIQVRMPRVNLVVGCVYFPPASQLEAYQRFCDTAERLRNKYDESNFILMGDFNLPNVNWLAEEDVMVPQHIGGNTAEVLIECMFFLELHQVNRAFNVNNRLLDLIFVSDL